MAYRTGDVRAARSLRPEKSNAKAAAKSPERKRMNHGYVISDLHMFAHRSVAGEWMDRMLAAAEQADFFVLNGDIFDFRWSKFRSLDETADAAAEWLRSFVTRRPQCKFFYILGNHDGLQCLAERLDAISDQAENLEWRPACLRLGDSLFLHGDLAWGADGSGLLTRELLPKTRRRGHTMNLAYRALVAMRLHRLPAVFHTPERCADRIMRQLEAAPRGLRQGLTDVYFGHTHATFSNYKRHGIRFHNTGAAIRGLDCNLIRARTRRSDP